MCGTGASTSTTTTTTSSHFTGTALPTGGNPGHVEFFFDDGWTLYLTSANGAKRLKGSVKGPVIDVTQSHWYGAEHDLNTDIIKRLESLAVEIEKCRNNRLPVIIHCNHGRTRSVISIGIFLMMMFGHSASEALDILKGIFSIMDPARAHYDKPGERVERALLIYEATRGSAVSSGGAGSSGSVPSSAGSSSSAAPRRSARIAKTTVCDGKCG